MMNDTLTFFFIGEEKQVYYGASQDEILGGIVHMKWCIMFSSSNRESVEKQLKDRAYSSVHKSKSYLVVIKW